MYQIVPIHFSFVLSHLLTKEKLSGGGGSKEFYCYAWRSMYVDAWPTDVYLRGKPEKIHLYMDDQGRVSIEHCSPKSPQGDAILTVTVYV